MIFPFLVAKILQLLKLQRDTFLRRKSAVFVRWLSSKGEEDTSLRFFLYEYANKFAPLFCYIYFTRGAGCNFRMTRPNEKYGQDTHYFTVKNNEIPTRHPIPSFAFLRPPLPSRAPVNKLSKHFIATITRRYDLFPTTTVASLFLSFSSESP